MRVLPIATLVLAAPLLPSVADGAGLVKPPEEACSYLVEQGLGTADDYREYRQGKFYCWSLRKPIPAGDPQRHNVRYTAEGSAEAVSALVLELQLVSRSEVQRAHRLLLDYARELTKQALGEDLPEDVAKSVISARPGRWPVAGAEVTIEKRQVQGLTYELVFRIQ
jgi:hypothetical protein